MTGSRGRTPRCRCGCTWSRGGAPASRALFRAAILGGRGRAPRDGGCAAARARTPRAGRTCSRCALRASADDSDTACGDAHRAPSPAGARPRVGRSIHRSTPAERQAHGCAQASPCRAARCRRRPRSESLARQAGARSRELRRSHSAGRLPEPIARAERSAACKTCHSWPVPVANCVPAVPLRGQ
jgi:hypothetical protein